MIFLKNTWKYDISFKCPEGMVFPKKSHWNMIFLVYLEKWYFYSGKYYNFSFDGKWKTIFLKKYKEIWYFLYICINIINMILPSARKKKSKMIFSPKNTLTADWHSRSHSRKSSKDFLYFYGDLHRRFHILLSSEKKSGSLIYRIEFWLILQFIWNLQFSVTIQPAWVVFRGVFERQLRKLFVHSLRDWIYIQKYNSGGKTFKL